MFACFFCCFHFAVSTFRLEQNSDNRLIRAKNTERTGGENIHENDLSYYDILSGYRMPFVFYLIVVQRTASSLGLINMPPINGDPLQYYFGYSPDRSYDDTRIGDELSPPTGHPNTDLSMLHGDVSSFDAI